MTDALKAQGLSFSYDRQHRLEVDELSLPRGAVMGLIGPNGSGKSTLMKLLALLMKPQSGRILFFGEPSEGREALLRGMGITMLLQRPCLLKRSVRANLMGPIWREPDREERAREALYMVGLGEAYLDRPWYRLSGGEAQRVALAVRLALRPRVLLLDEPVSNVDQEAAQVVRGAVIQARDRWGTSVLVSSHQPAWLSGFCEGFLVMRDGRLIGAYGSRDQRVVT
ncbi:MAG: energy-coupling factor ABC transporter ATP-binding protein [Thermanaerothrix sp.]|nr:energy-coupling factor ABC transporter ATP-binding protein [Thermanaerothrix sp.]